MNASSDQGGRICHPSSWPRMRPRILDRCLELHRLNLRSVVIDTVTMPRSTVVNRAELCKSTAGASSEISAGSGNILFKGPSTSTDAVGSRTNQAMTERMCSEECAPLCYQQPSRCTRKKHSERNGAAPIPLLRRAMTIRCDERGKSQTSQRCRKRGKRTTSWLSI